jgi:hypothetical protein
MTWIQNGSAQSWIADGLTSGRWYGGFMDGEAGPVCMISMPPPMATGCVGPRQWRKLSKQSGTLVIILSLILVHTTRYVYYYFIVFRVCIGLLLRMYMYVCTHHHHLMLRGSLYCVLCTVLNLPEVSFSYLGPPFFCSLDVYIFC